MCTRGWNFGRFTALFLTSLFASTAAATSIVQFVVYVDEGGTAFYLGVKEGATGCVANPFGSQFKCPVVFTKGTNGKPPTVTFPTNRRLFVKAGDVLLTEAHSSVPSDVIRFGPNSLMFFSDTDEETNDPNDTTLPTTSGLTGHPEVDLSNLDIALTQDVNNSLKLAGFLKGKVGIYYVATPKDIGGTTGASDGIGYIFVSDGEVPEPRLSIPIGALAGLLLAIQHRRGSASRITA